MKNFNRKNLLYFFTFIIFILIFLFIIYLLKFKIWTYKTYSIIKDTSVEYKVILKKQEKNIFYDNNYLFLNNKKYIYKIESITNIDNNILITLKFKNKLESNKNIETITIQDTKKNLFSLIIESWREK